MEKKELDNALKKKLKKSRDEAEMLKVIAEAGLELNDDMLDAVSGGWNRDKNVPNAPCDVRDCPGGYE